MRPPPFALARTSVQAGARTLDTAGCCTPAPPSRANVGRRPGLTDLDAHFHCSIIGTCLSTGELRRIVQSAISLAKDADDIEIHHDAVSLANQGGQGARAIQKALEQRHGAAVRQFASATDADAVLARWNHALASGDIPGAYWATMTHPATSPAVRKKAFGDVHMLSHLVGAANRADIRRLVALESENQALKAQAAEQQVRIQGMGAEHAEALRQVHEEVAVLRGRQQATSPAVFADAVDRQALIMAQAQRIATAEAREAHASEIVKTLQDEIDNLRLQLEAARSEASAVESLVAELHARNDETCIDPRALADKQIVYVGGRPGTISTIKALVERAGGRFQDHDGGLEDRKGRLPAMIASADVVVFPVDCVDHDSVNTLKRVCQHHGIAYHPLRSASVASFVDLMQRLGLNQV
nr:DUF2325 domain-containing protein [uncultured Cupriavidus sp.]